MWPLVNGVALAENPKTVFCLGSDGSQQEGDDAEAARFAVAQGLNVKLLIDNNDVRLRKRILDYLLLTIVAGHHRRAPESMQAASRMPSHSRPDSPTADLKGYDVAKTLAGQGMHVISVQGENVDELWAGIAEAVSHKGPVAVVSNRKMAPGLGELEGQSEVHLLLSMTLNGPLTRSLAGSRGCPRQDCHQVPHGTRLRQRCHRHPAQYEGTLDDVHQSSTERSWS